MIPEPIQSRLLALRTEHPGGYADILQALQANAGHKLTFQKFVRWDTVDNGKKDDRGKPVLESVPVYRAETILAGEVLEDIGLELARLDPPPAGGILAATFQVVLRKYQLPVPGSPAWTQPADQWFKSQ